MASPYETHLMFKVLLIGDTNVGKSCFILRYAEETFTEKFISTIGIDFRIKTIERKGHRIRLQIWDTAGQERFRSISTSYYRGALGFLLVFDLTNKGSLIEVKDWLQRIDDHALDNPEVVIIGNKSDLVAKLKTHHQPGSITINNNNNFSDINYGYGYGPSGYLGPGRSGRVSPYLPKNDPYSFGIDRVTRPRAPATPTTPETASTSWSAEVALLAQRRNLMYFEASAKTGENVAGAFEALADKVIDRRVKEMPFGTSESKDSPVVVSGEPMTGLTGMTPGAVFNLARSPSLRQKNGKKKSRSKKRGCYCLNFRP